MSKEEEEEGNNPIPEFLAGIFAAKMADQEKVKARNDKFHLRAEGVAQTLRVSVYGVTDQPNGPNEGSALYALKSWQKASNKVNKILTEVHPAYREAWIAAVTGMMRITASQAPCECSTCVAIRKERGEEG